MYARCDKCYRTFPPLDARSAFCWWSRTAACRMANSCGECGLSKNSFANGIRIGRHLKVASSISRWQGCTPCRSTREEKWYNRRGSREAYCCLFDRLGWMGREAAYSYRTDGAEKMKGALLLSQFLLFETVHIQTISPWCETPSLSTTKHTKHLKSSRITYGAMFTLTLWLLVDLGSLYQCF